MPVPMVTTKQPGMIRPNSRETRPQKNRGSPIPKERYSTKSPQRRSVNNRHAPKAPSIPPGISPHQVIFCVIAIVVITNTPQPMPVNNDNRTNCETTSSTTLPELTLTGAPICTDGPQAATQPAPKPPSKAPARIIPACRMRIPHKYRNSPTAGNITSDNQPVFKYRSKNSSP